MSCREPVGKTVTTADRQRGLWHIGLVAVNSLQVVTHYGVDEVRPYQVEGIEVVAAKWLGSQGNGGLLRRCGVGWIKLATPQRSGDRDRVAPAWLHPAEVTDKTQFLRGIAPEHIVAVGQQEHTRPLLVESDVGASTAMGKGGRPVEGIRTRQQRRTDCFQAFYTPRSIEPTDAKFNTLEPRRYVQCHVLLDQIDAIEVLRSRNVVVELAIPQAAR